MKLYMLVYIGLYIAEPTHPMYRVLEVFVDSRRAEAALFQKQSVASDPKRYRIIEQAITQF